MTKCSVLPEEGYFTESGQQVGGSKGRGRRVRQVGRGTDEGDVVGGGEVGLQERKVSIRKGLHKVSDFDLEGTGEPCRVSHGRPSPGIIVMIDRLRRRH